MLFDRNVFHVQEYYARGGTEQEKILIDYVSGAIDILGCNEIWMPTRGGVAPPLPSTWEQSGTHVVARYTQV